VIPLTLDEIAALAPGRLDRAAWAAEATGVQVDSRRIAEGDLFVAVGRGADFCKHAFARGAAATLVPDDAFAALGAIGHAVRQRASARVVGITGSMGKTSTKDLLAALCAPSARTVANEGNFNNEIGVPLTLCRLQPDSEVCILELAMRGLGQIAELCKIALPEIGVITNIGPVHLELVDSLEGVIQAKGELVAALPPGGVAIVLARGGQRWAHVGRWRQLQLRRRAPGRERGGSAGCPGCARAAAARACRCRLLPLARGGARAPRRRFADQRRL